jgi:hypothetical protein
MGDALEEKRLYTFEVTNFFDVWGNKKEGYEVNNLCHEPDIRCRWKKLSILRALKRAGLIVSGARAASIEWENTGSGYILSIPYKVSEDKGGGMPLFEVRNKDF